MPRVLVLQSRMVRPGPASKHSGWYALEVEFEAELESGARSELTAVIWYADGREISWELSHEPVAKNEHDVMLAFARRIAHDALCDGREIPLTCPITSPVPVVRGYRFDLHGEQGASLKGWQSPEDSPRR